jgi:hypothetical protein
MIKKELLGFESGFEPMTSLTPSKWVRKSFGWLVRVLVIGMFRFQDQENLQFADQILRAADFGHQLDVILVTYRI